MPDDAVGESSCDRGRETDGCVSVGFQVLRSLNLSLVSSRASKAALHSKTRLQLRQSGVTFLNLFFVVVSATVFSGCSCKKHPEWDSGLRDTGGSSSAQRTRSAAGNTHAAGDGGGTATGASPEAGSTSSSGETDKADPGHGGADEGNGSKSADLSKDTANADAGAGGQGGRGTAAEDDSRSAGVSSDSSEPPTTFPGRPPSKPRYDPATAAEVAERHLKQAAAQRSAGDIGGAFVAASKAFDAVEPHATADDVCKEIWARAGTMLRDLAERQNRNPRPQAKPSFLE